jgi:hypothetical protein
VPADPDAHRARDTGALLDVSPPEGDADATREVEASRLDEFFKTDDGNGAKPKDRDAAPAKAPKRPSLTRERREVSAKPPAVRRAPRMQARKVHRLVRHIEPWSVLKVSLIFFFCIWVILLTSAVILWKVASSSGVIDNVESFIEEIFALDSFSFEAGQMFRAYAVGGLVMVVAATGFTVLLAVLFNLISDLTGGVRVTVVEEETARYAEEQPHPASGPDTGLQPALPPR